ncbi:unnamed protein product, partial [marine sediment metagenome]
VLYVGAKPVFVDINPKTYNIDVNKIEEKITDKTKAIIPVHSFGQCVDMDPLLKIAKEYNLRVIEDCACAIGSKYKNIFAGSIGDIGCFSFHARKNITSGEGGIITTNNENLAEEIRSLSCFGVESAYKRSKKFIVPKFVKLGHNYKLSDIAAAIAKVQLTRSEECIRKKNELAKYYDEKLSQVELIEVPYVEKYNRHVYQTYAAMVNENVNRNKLIMNLKEKGIQAQIGTYALHRQPIYKKVTSCNELE